MNLLLQSERISFATWHILDCAWSLFRMCELRNARHLDGLLEVVGYLLEVAGVPEGFGDLESGGRILHPSIRLHRCNLRGLLT